MRNALLGARSTTEGALGRLFILYHYRAINTGGASAPLSGTRRGSRIRSERPGLEWSQRRLKPVSRRHYGEITLIPEPQQAEGRGQL
ncbi:unnamed protein product [Boreogadus saida]